MKYSLIITAWNEPLTIAESLANIVNPDSGNKLPEMEILVICPDIVTYNSAKAVCEKYSFPNIKHIQDQNKGKPAALNLGIKNSSGEILIFTDGDVVIGKDAFRNLIKPLQNSEFGASCGRPVSRDSKKNLLGYWGHLLADAAHTERSRIASLGQSYHVSGYLYAIRKIEGLLFPENILVDDAWISLQIVKKGLRIAYSPDSLVYISYPKNLKDWFRQKRRSAGGYSQLKIISGEDSGKYNIPDRSFLEEIKYILFPITYAKSLRQFFYSLLLYPARAIQWIIIFFDKITGKHQKGLDLWVRIESTK